METIKITTNGVEKLAFEGPKTCAVCGEGFTQMVVGHTLMAYHDFVDILGLKHHHDPNQQWALFTCRNGHEMDIPFTKRCPVVLCKAKLAGEKR